jgi:hypothetical protein
MPIDPKYIDQIANNLTDDPDVFKEGFGAVAKAGVEAGKKCAANPTCRKAAVGAGKWALDKGKEFLDKKKAPPTAQVETEEDEGLSESFTNCCRNKVYRRGTVMNCNRLCNSVYCEGCEEALEEARIRVLGLSEAKKEPSNKPDDLEVEDSFEVHDDYDEDKKEPGEPGKQKRKSSLQDGPEGEKGSKKKPYLEADASAEAAAQRLRNAGLGLDQKPTAKPVAKKPAKDDKKKAAAEAAAQRLRDAGLGLD